MIPQTLISLVSKTASGDYEAFEKLITSHNPFIYWIIHSMTDCPEDAEDIRQEVSFRIFRYIASLRRPEAFSSWLHSIVVRECIRFFTSQKLSVSIETLQYPENIFIDTDPDCIPSKHVERHELKTALESAIGGLREPARRIFQMRYCVGMRCCDIAAATGVEARTVSVILFRVKEQLKEILSDRGIHC